MENHVIVTRNNSASKKMTVAYRFKRQQETSGRMLSQHHMHSGNRANNPVLSGIKTACPAQHSNVDRGIMQMTNCVSTRTCMSISAWFEPDRLQLQVQLHLGELYLRWDKCTRAATEIRLHFRLAWVDRI